MGKLTPTFADKLKEGASLGAMASVMANGNGTHIEAAHEPTKSETEAKGSAIGTGGVQVNFTGNGVVPVAEPVPLKIALIGTAPSSRMLAPFNDPSWTIWACSPGNMNVLPRADVWFEIHGNLMWPEHASYGPGYVEWLKRLTIPVYMQDQSLVPQALTFPKDELVQEFGRDFFTSSFAWMMAFAMKKGAKEIALYGIDMASKDEYLLQRPGFYFFRHIAEQRGIKVSAPNESDIMQPSPLYGYSEVSPIGRKIIARRVELEQRLGPMIQERDKLNHNITYLQGALEDVQYFEQIWSGAQS